MFPFLNPNTGFEAHYRAMPVAFIDKQQAEFGDKVILPPSALDRLASLHIEYPMLFKVEGLQSHRSTHCGVLEFVAEEGVVYMPHWMMQNLALQVGDTVKMRNVSLPKGKYVKLQPVTSDFLDISNPKAVLERTLRSYTCLTVGDTFVVYYNNKTYEIEVKEAKPGSAISVIETDCQVDFEAPKDYKEPEPVRPIQKPEPMQEDNKPGPSKQQTEQEPEQPKFLAFAGAARRLDGKQVAHTAAASTSAPAVNGASTSTAAQPSSGPPPGSSKSGTFVSVPGNRLAAKLAAKSGSTGPKPAPPPVEEPKDDPKFTPFGGKGYSLKS